jgi:hypothetical protein
MAASSQRTPTQRSEGSPLFRAIVIVFGLAAIAGAIASLLSVFGHVIDGICGGDFGACAPQPVSLGGADTRALILFPLGVAALTIGILWRALGPSRRALVALTLATLIVLVELLVRR